MTTKEEAAVKVAADLYPISAIRPSLPVVDGMSILTLARNQIEKVFIAGANWRAENPDWKEPEKDGWPKKGDLALFEWGDCSNGMELFEELDQWVIKPKRWLLIERAK